MPDLRVHLETLGCRVNQSEVETIARELATCGVSICGCAAESDICIVNTCAVTAAAGQKSRRRVLALARANPDVRIAVTGCYATLAPEKCRTLPSVEWVLPNADKPRVTELVLQADRDSMSLCVETAHQACFLKTRAFVKVQDGCDNSCTYCLIRHLRGPSVSRPIPEIIPEVSSLVAGGTQEAVLCGVNLGSYGRDRGSGHSLKSLVLAILRGTDLPRLRLSSLEPWDIDPTFFGLWEDSRLCRSVHLPLQAGCDSTLRRMGRRITLGDFVQLVDAARESVPDIAVTTDVIVGFPGEDDTAFRTSYDFVAAMSFARVHVFSYSPRPGTAAVHLPDQIPPAAVHARADAMRKLAARKSCVFNSRFVGQRVTVLWERRHSDGWCSGLTDNYLRVDAQTNDELHNRLTDVQLVGLRDGRLLGELACVLDK